MTLMMMTMMRKTTFQTVTTMMSQLRMRVSHPRNDLKMRRPNNLAKNLSFK